MTNREYLESLSDKELAKILWDYNIWDEYCFAKAERYDIESYDENCDRLWEEACIKALAEWLSLEHNGGVANDK